MKGVYQSMLPSYLDEYMWRERYDRTASTALSNICRHRIKISTVKTAACVYSVCVCVCVSETLASSALSVTGYSRAHQWINTIHCCKVRWDLAKKVPSRSPTDFLQLSTGHLHLYDAFYVLLWWCACAHSVNRASLFYYYLYLSLTSLRGCMTMLWLQAGHSLLTARRPLHLNQSICCSMSADSGKSKMLMALDVVLPRALASKVIDWSLSASHCRQYRSLNNYMRSSTLQNRNIFTR